MKTVKEGERFGRLTVTGYKATERWSNGKLKYVYYCKCDCGETVEVDVYNLLSGRSTSCGCYVREIKKIRRDKEMLGKRFGKLTVIEPVETEKKSNGKDYIVRYRCKCDCGNTCIVRYSQLVGGLTKSCGCLHHEIPAEKYAVNKDSVNSRLYWIHAGILDRTKNNPVYIPRGIAAEWALPNGVGYKNFKEWSYKNGYYEQPKETPRKDKLTIDRWPDPEGPYSPDNCRWVTMKEQSNNRWTNSKIRINNKIYNYAQAAEVFGLGEHFINHRVMGGWSNSAIAYAIEHQDLSVHRKNREYYDKCGFRVLIPRTNEDFPTAKGTGSNKTKLKGTDVVV